MVAASRFGTKFDDGASGRVTRVTRAISGLPPEVAAGIAAIESGFVVSALGFRRRCEMAYMTDTPLDATLRALLEEWGERRESTSAGLRAVLAGAILAYLDLASWGEPEESENHDGLGAGGRLTLSMRAASNEPPRESASRLARALLASLAAERPAPLEENNPQAGLFAPDALASWQLGRDARLAREIASRVSALARTTDALPRQAPRADSAAA